MSARFEEIVVFGVVSILVSLFAWIYLRDPQKTTRLWMLGWIAILIHFAVPAFDDFFPTLMRFTPWLMISTLLIAGTFFLLSVSEVFTEQTSRATFVVLISAAVPQIQPRGAVHVRIVPGLGLCFSRVGNFAGPCRNPRWEEHPLGLAEVFRGFWNDPNVV